MCKNKSINTITTKPREAQKPTNWVNQGTPFSVWERGNFGRLSQPLVGPSLKPHTPELSPKTSVFLLLFRHRPLWILN